MDPEVELDVTVVVGAMVVVVEADVVELLIDVVVGAVVDVVAGDVDGTSVACPVVEQATISSRDPSPIRIGIP